jgi:uncharacterized protein YkwD
MEMKSIAFLLLLYLPVSPAEITPNPADEICLNVEEKKLYDLIMDYRKSKKLKPIPFSSKLTKVAQAHVRDLMANFDYDNKNNCNPHSWSVKGDWTACCYTSDHKYAKCMWDKPREIGGYSGDGFEIAYFSSAGATAADGLEGWKKSAGHNPLLVNTGIWNKVEWKAIGLGVYEHYAVVWFGEVLDQSEKIECR